MAMSGKFTDNGRAQRLDKVFWAFVKGRRQVLGVHDGELFLEAVRSRPSAVSCLEDIVASDAGLSAIQTSVRMDLSTRFICSSVMPFLSYMTVPEVKAIYEGRFLQRLIRSVVSILPFWDSLVGLYLGDGFLNPTFDVETFAWLCLEVITHPGTELDSTAASLIVSLAQKPLLDSPYPKVREYGYCIERFTKLRGTTRNPLATDVETPGGRHDNDFADFRQTEIYPTTDEFSSTLRPFYRRAAEVADSDPELRPSIHLDNQFRLLREDMLAELRDNLQLANKKKRRAVHILGNLRLKDLDTGDAHRGRFSALRVSVGTGLEAIQTLTHDLRRKHLLENRKFLAHQSFGALCRTDQMICFGFVVRDLDLLCAEPPVLGLQFPSPNAMVKAISALIEPNNIRFVLVATPVFAYQPILERLKDMSEMPFEQQLLDLPGPPEHFQPSNATSQVIEHYLNEGKLHGSVKVGPNVHQLDHSQREALHYALSSAVSVIQGPPGTGKSYIGALAAKILSQPATTLLCISYTNHALDQFLQDIIKEGIDRSTVVRLGFRSSDATADLCFDTLSRKSEVWLRKRSKWMLHAQKQNMENLRDQAQSAFKDVQHGVSYTEILWHLEMSEDSRFWAAFQILSQNDGFTTAGKRGKTLTPEHILETWARGKHPGHTFHLLDRESIWLWEIPPIRRTQLYNDWAENIKREKMDTFRETIGRLERAQADTEAISNEGKCDFIKTMRVIGCTTTAAAKYSHFIKAAKPDIVIVEEAGEIQEAHVLTALHSETKQLILIGDHKQLRPKVNNYALSVEKGDGYDLNRSMFERLILQGHRVVTLTRQHRMVPEISQLVRSMTYPDLLDDDKTLKRPPTRGVIHRCTFVNHSEPEVDDAKIRDRGEPGSTGSKSNVFEARMVLKLIKYLGQQGYKTENIVILTPYLGQLRLLRDMLSAENDPWLNDLDNFELIRAGVITAAASKVGKSKIRLSTIDSYQGEESDIVIASLTRSNNRGDIGFMKAPERLNVLVSRARNCLIMVGSMETFMASKQGRDTWVPFFDILKTHGFLQDGLLVRCEQHPDKTAELSRPDDFVSRCPDGGCTDPCGATLKCGLHKCQRRCHRQIDHLNTRCNERLEKMCDDRGHKYSVQCHENMRRCPGCVREEEDIRRRAVLHLDLEKKRLEKENAYRRKLQIIQDEIDHETRLAKDAMDEINRQTSLQKSKSELETLRQTRNQRATAAKLAEDLAKETARTAVEYTSTSKNAAEDLPLDIDPGSAQDSWEHQKRSQHAQSAPLDTLMTMIGLEDVKLAFLTIKGEVDAARRQRMSTESERYGCVFLGNPGTGKTTVARIYAQFLTSMAVIPGNCFEETTGARLANMGVAGCQKLVDGILQKSGGALFIDEAYQLSSGNNPGGVAVLDFILAEIENLRGKIVFILAGYSKQMESFFAHNPGLPSRFPIEMKFADYTDQELLRILELNIQKKWSGNMKVEDGTRGLYCRVVARRVGAGRGKEGFGNARAVENALARIRRKQAERLTSERRTKGHPDDLHLTKLDLIGPEPTNALSKSHAWQALQKLVGLGSVKESLKALVDSIKVNYYRELKEEPLVQYSLNKVFLGNPGTGKTTVARLYGQVLADLGLLSSSEVVLKNPSDFIGAVLGGSQQQTKGILAAAAGKILVIDEAYGLYGSGSSDPFKTDVVDTIVAEIQSVPGEDRCVLLLGYKEQMEEMFQNVNPGLSRRFPLASAFSFEDFDQAELGKILDLKLEQQSFTVTKEARNVILEMLDRSRNRPHFGNAGEVDNLLNDAKSRHQKRLSAGQKQRDSILEPLDFDENFDRSLRSETNINKLFEGTVGCEKIVATLREYQEAARMARQLDMNPKDEVPFSFLFRGPPGTGKSTTARKMGKVFYDAGFLSSAELIDCSASDLVGQYVGQTGPKVRQLLDRALGRVLLIDEAYRLAEGQFAKDALDELVDALTKERYHKKLIVILAGYEGDINRLLSVNPGMTSRFPVVIDFHSLAPAECFHLLANSLRGKKTMVEQRKKGTVDTKCLERPAIAFLADCTTVFKELSLQSSWGSARDVKTLAASIYSSCSKHRTEENGIISISITEDAVRVELDKMLGERKSRTESISPLQPRVLKQRKSLPQDVAQYPSRQPQSIRTTSEKQQPERDDDAPSSPKQPRIEHKARQRRAIRDAGVSDEVWDRLQRDAAVEAGQEAEHGRKLEEREAVNGALREQIVREILAEEECRKKKEEEKRKLAISGLCPAGYHWIQQAGGYRCAGGSHFVSGDQLSEL